MQFLLNNELIKINQIDPTKSVLSYLREDKFLTGTKEGCAEGDCGACTVVIAEKEQQGLSLKSVNACIQFVPTLNGKAVFTVEFLRKQNKGQLHPAQQAMVDKHGSQCGFCTPGFIMSLWCLYNEHQTAKTIPIRSEVRSALTGNLCRCTGYKPILQAADAMFEEKPVYFDNDGLRDKLTELNNNITSTTPAEHFYSPTTTKELVKLRAQYPDATILAGGTDVGLWVNKQFKELNSIIYIGDVNELKAITEDDQHITIGAGATLTQSYQALKKHYPEMNQMWERFASTPIRNIGTLGGNIANGSPIGDSMPALIALGTRIVLSSVSGDRELLLEDFYLDYMKKDIQADEVVTWIKIPTPKAAQQFRCYKLSKRYDSDISAVFTGMAITLDDDKVSDIKIAFGGMAATSKRASHCEQALLGNTWDEATVKQAMEALKQDYSPMTDMRASDENRMQSAMNLLYRFYLETRPVNPLSKEMTDVFGEV
ncbi:xanthine dehydrogenase small subunit [Leucothrix sargassi]|nr:xanthine dehydrogenase small subunit [Leucothrix sargassi]